MYILDIHIIVDVVEIKLFLYYMCIYDTCILCVLCYILYTHICTLYVLYIHIIHNIYTWNIFTHTYIWFLYMDFEFGDLAKLAY